MMKQIFPLSLLTVLALSCSLQEMDPATAPEPASAPVFFARMEEASGSDTRVFADTKLRVLWDENDHVSIFNKSTANQEYRFTGITGDNCGTFQRVGTTGTGDALDLVYSVYPYREGTRIGKDGVLSVSLPSRQTYREDSFGLGDNTMVSCTTENLLLYKNICGYLMLKLYGDSATVTSISLSGNGGEPLAGTAAVQASVDGTPSFTFGADATKEITLTFDTPVTLGTTAETATVFWLVVPPTVFSQGVTVTVQGGEYGFFQKSTDKRIEVGRNTLTKMSALEVDLGNPETRIFYYTSTDGKTVEPHVTDAFGANILFNEYIDGQGMLVFDGDITCIGDEAFRGCSRLASVTIPESVTRIGASAFSGCTSLESIDAVPVTPPAGSSGMFSNTGNCPIYVPAGSVDAYQAADYWSEYADRIRVRGISVSRYMRQTKGNKPVDICVIPEGFTLDELDKFDRLAAEGIDYLFATEPYKSYKDYFNVYFLRIPSQESGAAVSDGNGTVTEPKNTAFGAHWGTDSYSDMGADEDTVYGFVETYCPEIANGTLRIQDVPVLMIINDTRFGGICRSISDGRGFAMVPYINGGGSLRWSFPSLIASQDEPVPEGEDYNNYGRYISSGELNAIGTSIGTWKNALIHEFGGHCFGRLEDEYWYSSYYTSQGSIISQILYQVPFGLNISGFYDTVPWSELLGVRDNLVAIDANYGRIGRFQGAQVSLFNRWRSEMVSCMIDNRPYFSTWQRVLIVKKIMEKAGMEFSFEEFLAKDVTLDPVRDQTSSAILGVDPSRPVRDVPLLPPPVVTLADGR